MGVFKVPAGSGIRVLFEILVVTLTDETMNALMRIDIFLEDLLLLS
jgi:hypothetical protein